MVIGRELIYVGTRGLSILRNGNGESAYVNQVTINVDVKRNLQTILDAVSIAPNDGIKNRMIRVRQKFGLLTKTIRTG